MVFESLSHRALNRAFTLSKKLRNIHIHYIWYTSNFPMEAENIKIKIYMQTVLNEYTQALSQALWQWQLNQWFLTLFNYRCPIWYTREQIVALASKNGSLLKEDKQLIWVIAILDELVPNIYKSNKKLAYSDDKRRSYESIGLIPRSITRTLTRFQRELRSRSRSLVLSDFRLLKYQVIASLEYLISTICLLWLTSSFSKWVVFHPMINSYWHRINSLLFINISQQEEALRKLQNIEELVWLELVLDPLQNIDVMLHRRTLDLVDMYTAESINTLFHLVNGFCLTGCLIFILILGRKRLAILNSWIQELFYSLSDTMKAFLILLCTDLCIGFHSPHGWEIGINWAVEQLGFAHNPYIVSCIVSTFPVIIDTIFKYWIFRHLNRISPSIVVTYHTMNE